jgi:hypothetical protein
MRNLDRLRAELNRRGHRIIDPGALGLGIEFDGGCDVGWVLPGEPLSSIEVSPNFEFDADAAAPQFERLNNLRMEAARAVRHHLARRRFRVIRARREHWPIQTETGGVGTSASRWNWTYAPSELLKSVVVHGWREVAEELARNDYLIDALLHSDRMLCSAAGSVLLAWSRLLPGEWLARLVGTLLAQDLPGRADTVTRRIVGAKTPEFEKMVPGVADHLTAQLQRHLAVAWTRCRPFVF